MKIEFEKVYLYILISFTKLCIFNVIYNIKLLDDSRELIHASSEKKKTVKENFIDYVNNNGSPRFDGIMFYKFYSTG